MKSNSSQRSATGLRNRTSDRIVAINWKLLFARLRQRFALLFRSARHRASQTEYTPPAWATNFRFGWFRLGLVALALFVFTQKQVDFTVSVGKNGIGATSNSQALNVSSATATAQKTSHSPDRLSVLPGVGNTAQTAKAWSVDQYETAAVDAYVKRFARVAQTEAEKYGIPAAAKLAMAIYESEAGTHPRAIENNNHFGAATPDGFYPNAWANWRAHSEYLNRYHADLKAYTNGTENWISMLARSSYTNDPDYDSKLLAIVERFGLDRY